MPFFEKMHENCRFFGNPGKSLGNLCRASPESRKTFLRHAKVVNPWQHLPLYAGNFGSRKSLGKILLFDVVFHGFHQ
jgi:hypothetical protein